MSSRDDALKRVPLFADLTTRQLRGLGRKLRERQFKPGTAIVREGEMSGIGFFIIASGQARVSEGGRDIGSLEPGDHFGELGLIVERERTATVTAETQLDCLELAVWDFRELGKSDGDLAWRLLQHVVTTLAGDRSA